MSLHSVLTQGGRDLSALAEMFPGLVFAADARGLSTYSSATFQEFSGRSARALSGNGWLAVLHPDDRGWVDAAWREAVERRTPFQAEFRLRRRDGVHLWHLCRVEPVQVQHGNGLEWIGTCIDVDERKQREDALRQSQDLLSRAFTAAPDAMSLSSVGDYVVREVNESYLKLFGLSRDEIVGRGSLGLAVTAEPEDRERVLGILEHEGRVRDVELELNRRNGGKRVALLMVEPIDFRGERLLLTRLRDVTEHTRMQEELRRERELLQTIIDRIPVMITLYDPETDVIQVNAEFERLLGYGDQPSLSALMEACYPDPEERERITAFMRSGSDRWMDIRMRTRSGADLDTAWANVQLSGGTQVGIGIDISQRKQAEQALRESARRKDQFLAVLAHELRNPLAPLRTGLELLELSGVTDRTVVHVREMMQRQLSHVVHLVDDLMDVSRVRRGKIELQKRPVDLRDVVDAAVEQMRPTLEERRHRLVLEEPAAALPVEGDAERLTQVLGNLMSNAAKYTEPGGTITLTAGQQGEQAVVRVTDTGMGIPPHRLDELFDMFAQIPEHQEHTGAGLGIGLALSRQLVELHGGTIDAASDGLGHGSTFTVRLPLQMPH